MSTAWASTMFVALFQSAKRATLNSRGHFTYTAHDTASWKKTPIQTH